MKARKRYLLLIVCIAFLTVLYFGFVRLRLLSPLNGARGNLLIQLLPLPFKSYPPPPSAASSSSSTSRRSAPERPSYLSGHDVDISSPLRENDEKYLRKGNIWKPIRSQKSYSSVSQVLNHMEFAANCRLSNCFDMSRCKPGEKLKVHIYPDSKSSPNLVISATYQKILNVIRSSIHYEPDPSKACLFVTRYDSLDRDSLSPDYQKSLPQLLPLDNGRNHLVFNLYSGSWPDYHELDFSGFNPGYAILVKASSSLENHRPGFDVSLPLFSKSHPERGAVVTGGNTPSGNEPEEEGIVISRAEEETIFNGKKSLLVFKGKRYIYGIGSDTRNSLHHLHNGKEILIYTTCKHGKKWKELRDDRCERDNKEYEKFDYSALLANSTFCLVPRGRRLGSFRFLEALAFGCIPVILSNSWVKPFDDVIDWSSVVVEGDERLLLQLPEVLRSFDQNKLEKMRSQGLAIYENYFSSVERIVFTTIAILTERIHSQLSLNSFLWNLVNPGFTGFSGAIWFDYEFSRNLADYPGYRQSFIAHEKANEDGNGNINGNGNWKQRRQGFTCVVYINRPVAVSSIHKLIKTVSKSQFIARIILVWSLPASPPASLTKSSPFMSSSVPVNLILPQVKTINGKLYPYELIQTDAVLSLDPESTLTPEELDFGFLIWSSFPHRLVGFTARDHYFDEVRSDWYYTSKWTNQYSILLLDATFYHRYYGWVYTHHISSMALNGVEENGNLDGLEPAQDQVHPSDSLYLDDDLCLDLVFNFLVTHITREGPIKVTQRKRATSSSSTGPGLGGRVLTSEANGFTSRQKCFSTLINKSFGYLPLIKSQLRLDPVLFKDPVSNLRKKYRKLEQAS